MLSGIFCRGQDYASGDASGCISLNGQAAGQTARLDIRWWAGGESRRKLDARREAFARLYAEISRNFAQLPPGKCRHSEYGESESAEMNWRVKIHTAATRAERIGSGDRPGLGRGSEPHRHPAMSGLDISPVHGRHCICHGCERHAHRDAA